MMNEFQNKKGCEFTAFFILKLKCTRHDSNMRLLDS